MSTPSKSPRPDRPSLPTRACSSVGQSSGLLSRGSGVRTPPGAPSKGTAKTPKVCARPAGDLTAKTQGCAGGLRAPPVALRASPADRSLPPSDRSLPPSPPAPPFVSFVPFVIVPRRSRRARHPRRSSCSSVSPFVPSVISPLLAVLSAVADPQIRHNPRDLRFPPSSIQSCAGHARAPLCVRCALCDCPPSCSSSPLFFVFLRVPLRALRDPPPSPPPLFERAKKSACIATGALLFYVPFSAPLAQLDRASDYGSEGWRFKSSKARH